MARSRFDLVHVEMHPGDVLFFHSNLLHTSAQNDSDLRRWALITAVNRRDNEGPAHHHAPYHPMRMVDNGAIERCNR